MRKLFFAIIFIPIIVFGQYDDIIVVDTFYYNLFNPTICVNENYNYVYVQWEDFLHQPIGGDNCLDIPYSGKFYVVGQLENGDEFIDSVEAVGKRCALFDYKVLINDQYLYEDDTFEICIEPAVKKLPIQVNIILHDTQPYYSEYFYCYGYFDEQNIDTSMTLGLNNFDLEIYESGIYMLTLSIIDEAGCSIEKYFFIKINRPIKANLQDTTIIALDNSIELNARKLLQYNDYVFYDTHDFINRLYSDFYGAYSSTILVKTANPNSILTDSNDIRITVKMAMDSINNVDMGLLDSSNNNFFPVAKSEVTLYEPYLVGEPDLYYNNLDCFMPYFYIFSFYGNDYLLNNTFWINYYTPCGDYIGEVNIILPEHYKFFSSNFYGIPVNNNWSFLINYNGFDLNMGYIESFSLHFSKRFFLKRKQPEIFWVYANDTISDTLLKVKPNTKATLFIKNGNCIQSKNIKIVQPLPEEYQNFVTPNGDGVNDRWTYITQFPKDTYVRIFSTDGVLLGKFPVQLYPKGWDGTLNGKPLKKGIYVFIITPPNGEPVKGQIAIIR